MESPASSAAPLHTAVKPDPGDRPMCAAAPLTRARERERCREGGGWRREHGRGDRARERMGAIEWREGLGVEGGEKVGGENMEKRDGR